MNFSFCSSGYKVVFPRPESFHFREKSLFAKKSFIKVCSHDTRKSVISSHLMPESLEGLYVGDRRLKEASCKLKAVRTLLIDNYDSYTYNIYQELTIINGVPPVVVRNDDWTWEDACYYLYEKKAFDNIVISPGPGSPTCAADIGICIQLLHKCSDIPILGVCLGHQALGHAHGANIVHAPEPVHGRLSEIQHNGCRLFHNVPSGKNSGFKVVRYHSLVIDAASLPGELLPIAWTSATDTLSFHEIQHPECIAGANGSQITQKIASKSFSTNTKTRCGWALSSAKGSQNVGLIMGVMHSTRPHYGLQFHPESIATCHGRQIFKNFREITVDYWLGLKSSFTKEWVNSNSNSVRWGDSDNKTQVGPNSHSYSVDGLIPIINQPNGLQHHNVDPSCPTSRDKFLRLNWRKFDSLAKQVGGAQNIFCKLFGDHEAQNTFWLDSSSSEKKRARFSFMGGKGGALWKKITYRLVDERDATHKDGGYLSIEDAQGSINNVILKDGFFDFLNQELQSFCYEEREYEGLPFDFYGGYIGYIGYELKAECGMTFNRHKSRMPDACFFFVDSFVVIDHHHDDVYIMLLHDGKSSSILWLDDIEQQLLKITEPDAEKSTLQSPRSATYNPCRVGFITDRSRVQYIKDIERCLTFIKEGESYELCLTTQMRKEIRNIDFLGLYLKLREENPAPYAAWLNFSNDNICICCSSPERFLRLDRNDILEAKPIKGTITRGSTQEEDEKLKFQLQYSEKDQAENLMIVDLLRNDLGRVCEPGSVHVAHLMEVESYATVHTMVSTIRGKKRSDVSPVDCVKAAFPGGSMTGAPKLRSMELLDSVECCSRGIYSGCIGYFSYNKTFDLNIVIRTVVLHESEASIGAGGAIVALSNPEAEYEEMILKTQAPARAVAEYENPVERKF